MPVFRIETNVPKSKIPDGFLLSTGELIAKTIDKPYCAVVIVPDTLISFGGTTDPCGNASLMCIDRLGVEQNKKIAAVIYDHIEKTLGIPKDRLYVLFVDPPTSVVGFKGTTMHEILGK